MLRQSRPGPVELSSQVGPALGKSVQVMYHSIFSQVFEGCFTQLWDLIPYFGFILLIDGGNILF